MAVEGMTVVVGVILGTWRGHVTELLCASSWGDSAERQSVGRGGYVEGLSGRGRVALDFLASGLRPRASVVVVHGAGVVVVLAFLASGLRPCASVVVVHGASVAAALLTETSSLLFGFSRNRLALSKSPTAARVHRVLVGAYVGGAASLVVALRRWRCVSGGGGDGVSALSA